MIDTVLDELGIEPVRGSLPPDRRKCSDFATIINAVRKAENNQQKKYTEVLDELMSERKLTNQLQARVSKLELALMAQQITSFASEAGLSEQDQAKLLEVANVA